MLMYLPVKFNDVFNFVWFRKKLYVNKASMGKCQLLNLNMVGIWIMFKTVHGKALGMRRGETNKKLHLRPVPHEGFHLFHFYSLHRWLR